MHRPKSRFPAGGTADLLARIISEWLQHRLGQPFVVENRPGAATNLATQAVVDATADGHTLLATMKKVRRPSRTPPGAHGRLLTWQQRRMRA
jgi:tripartite-type tricarboxylate transporter receptor subunit TctC